MNNHHTFDIMDIYVKYNFEVLCNKILAEQMTKFKIKYSLKGMGCVQLSSELSSEKYNSLLAELNKYGIRVIYDPKVIMVQKIKDAVLHILHEDNKMPVVKISAYLSDTLNESYRTLAQTFSEICYISIESFIIMHKIEIAKQLLGSNTVTLTEIAYRLNYSSVAHLSNQFKKVTGLTPTSFGKIITRKRKRKIITT